MSRDNVNLNVGVGVTSDETRGNSSKGRGQWVEAVGAEEVRQSGKKIVTVNGIEIGVFYVNGEYTAWRNVCPHAAAPVCEGRVCGTRLPSDVYEYEFGRDQEILRCPWHGWEFDLKTGEHLADSGLKLKGYPVEVSADRIYVQVGGSSRG